MRDKKKLTGQKWGILEGHSGMRKGLDSPQEKTRRKVRAGMRLKIGKDSLVAQRDYESSSEKGVSFLQRFRIWENIKENWEKLKAFPNS